jgi:hypothetical protein
VSCAPPWPREISRRWVGCAPVGSFDDVLQLVGDALLADRDSSLARDCVRRLRQRGLNGDGELADALEGGESDLRPIAVDLEELASVLEGDPVHGGGRIDLTTGDVRRVSPYDDRVDLDAEELDDPERWLWVEAGSDDGWRDMAEFAASVADPALAQRLGRAIQGAGRSGGSVRCRTRTRTSSRASTGSPTSAGAAARGAGSPSTVCARSRPASATDKPAGDRLAAATHRVPEGRPVPAPGGSLRPGPTG